MIYINSHEPKKIADLLSTKTEIKMENFSPGDYLVNDIAIERKTLNDFFNSLVSGRLFKQLSELKYYYSKPVLLLESFDLSFVKKKNVFYSVLIMILLDLNIKIIFSGSIGDSADILLLLNKRDKSIGRYFMPICKPIKNRASIEKRRLDILMCVYDIGRKRAEALLCEFKTVKGVIEAEEKRLLCVKGVGKKIVNELKRI